MFYHQQTNCYFLDYYAILEKAYSKAVDELTELGLLDIENTIIKFTDLNVRRIFQHHIIHTVCESVINCKQEGTKVIYYSLPFSGKSRYLGNIGEYEEPLLENLITKITNDMITHFPIIFYSGGRIKIADFQRLITLCDTGEAKHELNQVLGVVNNFDPTRYRFDKIRAVTKRKKLNFLSEEYFNQFKTRKLVYLR